MEPASPETLAFVAPGLLHQLGNVLFTIQGNAQAGGEPQRERKAILAATERGGQALRIWRCLLGDPAAAPAPAHALLAQLGDLLRVPLREANVTLDLRQSAAAGEVFVAATGFCIAIAEALRQLLAVVPPGGLGTLSIDLAEQGPRHATVTIGCQPPTGALPFPLDTDGLLQRIVRRLAAAHSPAVARGGAAGVELRFPGRGLAASAEA